jgi:hypothetical protein
MKGKETARMSFAGSFPAATTAVTQMLHLQKKKCRQPAASPAVTDKQT